MFTSELDTKLKLMFARRDKKLVVLTGAGVSAESGIPTFRGPEGFWTVGSKQYLPEEMATKRMFIQNPKDLWHWYLSRRSMCKNAKPNAGHKALFDMETKLNKNFRLITQNVDGLHLTAGNSKNETYQIHGNIHTMRCFNECHKTLYPLPNTVLDITKNSKINDDLLTDLKCIKCNSINRPHVLWFDEYYNEYFYRFESSLSEAQNCDCLVVAGTSGATTLPANIVNTVLQTKAVIINIDIEENAISRQIVPLGGHFIKSPSSVALQYLNTLI